MKCKLWTETPGFSRLKVPNSRFALHGKRPSLIHGLHAFFASNSRGLCAFIRPLLTPVTTAPFLPASQFTVCTSRFTRPRVFRFVYHSHFSAILGSSLLGLPAISPATMGPWPVFHSVASQGVNLDALDLEVWADGRAIHATRSNMFLPCCQPSSDSLPPVFDYVIILRNCCHVTVILLIRKIAAVHLQCNCNFSNSQSPWKLWVTDLGITWD